MALTNKDTQKGIFAVFDYPPDPPRSWYTDFLLVAIQASSYKHHQADYLPESIPMATRHSPDCVLFSLAHTTHFGQLRVVDVCLCIFFVVLMHVFPLHVAQHNIHDLKKNSMFLFLDAVPRRRELFSKRLSTHPLMCDRYICRCYLCMHWDNVKLQREHHRLYIKDGCHPQVSEVLFTSLKLKNYGCHHLGICKLDTMSGGRSDWETEGHCSC